MGVFSSFSDAVSACYSLSLSDMRRRDLGFAEPIPLPCQPSSSLGHACGSPPCQADSFRDPKVSVSINYQLDIGKIYAKTYPLPILVVNVSLLQSLTDLLLIPRRKILKAVESVKILRVTASFLDGFVEVGDQLRRDASPGRVSAYSKSESKG